MDGDTLGETDGETLAEAEIEYADHSSPSIYVRFKLLRLPDGVLPEAKALPTSVVIWTTTPWTIPANQALNIHPEFSYDLVDTERGLLVLATERRDEATGEVGRCHASSRMPHEPGSCDENETRLW